MSPELIAAVAGGLGGFAMQFIAQAQKNTQDRWNRLVKASELSNDNANQALARVSSDAGKAVRRFLVSAAVFGVIFVPAIMPLIGIPVFTEITQNQPGFLGLIPESTRTYFIGISGYLLSAEVKCIMISIVTFYFGVSVKAN